MVSSSAVREALQEIGRRTDDDMSERDVENLFLETGFYDILGYEGTGTDIRSEFSLPDRSRPDYLTLDATDAVTAVYEFKEPTKDLADHTSQLFGYVAELDADYGVLTNGTEIHVYHADQSLLLPRINTGEITELEARNIDSALEKRDYDLTDPDDVSEFLDRINPIALDGKSELGQEHFFDTFRLEEGTAFAELVVGLMDMLQELRDDQENTFVEGAYDFWEATYADTPDEVPDSWEPFIDGKQSLREFMFCLESGHALLARVLLAKATEDHDFFSDTTYDDMETYFTGLQGFGHEINLDAFPVAATNIINDMQEHLVEGLFQGPRLITSGRRIRS
jgi:hypothetical protein